MTGSDASPQAQVESEDGQQPSTSTSTSQDDTDMPDPAKNEQKVDDNSTGSDGGKGVGGDSGSGGGYSTDYSSSEASSLEAAKGGASEEQVYRCGTTKVKAARAKVPKPSKGLKGAQQQSQKAVRRGSDQTESSYSQSTKEQEHDYEYEYESSADASGSQEIVEQNTSLPQWNEKIFHTIDPRIDLSTVSHVHISSVPAFPSGQSAEPPENSVVGPPPPSIDQYIKLMEVNGQELIHCI
jgi:hypothetical protein